MNKFFLIFGFLLILSVASCNKSVIKYNTKFVGFWKTEIKLDNQTGIEKQSYLIIGNNHNEYGLSCQISCFECGCLKKTEGRAQVNSSRSKMRIGQSGNTFTLTINREPYLNLDSNWVCELNGDLYFKQ